MLNEILCSYGIGPHCDDLLYIFFHLPGVSRLLAMSVPFEPVRISGNRVKHYSFALPMPKQSRSRFMTNSISR